MYTTIIAMTIAAAVAVYWVEDNLACWFEAGTDSCVGCTDDCLDREGE